ncbi:transglycosylase SLT domain-containing protein [Campylobacter lanienae]|uniref:lytic transglycosylase domain-containing protein n=1 Tax=Campylobacter lanienae TaxID=75658 RepID=UPI002A90E0F1|nr:transglycosylase SLT domain-containing protein [Campylobacter lanienae]MDY6135294.1 transglycosylase SLT domain-containing protein [Campylobacter lanienae]
MRVILIGLFIVFTCNCSFGFMTSNDNFQKEIRILKELDIDPKYINDEYLWQLKSSRLNTTKQEFINTITKEYKHAAIIKDVLKQRGAPNSLLYLAIVESKLSNRATSGAKAAGIWQFMPSTAKLHNLNVDKYVDERRDPIQATHAAIDYLERLKDRFGKWYLAILAYNGGEGKLSRAIKKAGSDDIKTLLDPKRKYLSLETRNYILKIIMMAYVANDSDFLISKDSSMLNSATYIGIEKMEIPGGISLLDVASTIGFSVENLSKYNTHLRYSFTPPDRDKYYIYIPTIKKEEFLANYKVSQKTKIYNTKKGDTFDIIAKKLDIKASDIKKYNNIDKIQSNYKLALPSNAKTIYEYQVKKGDTLGAISRKFGVDIADIVKANSKTNMKLAIGENLVIPY